MRFIEHRAFSYLHVFSYSSRPGTKAASRPDRVSGAIIKRRARELRALGETKSEEFRQSQIGRKLRVLTLRRDPKDHPGRTPSLSENYISVLIPEVLQPNEFLAVSVERAEGKHLVARPSQPALVCAWGPL